MSEENRIRVETNMPQAIAELVQNSIHIKLGIITSVRIQSEMLAIMKGAKSDDEIEEEANTVSTAPVAVFTSP